MAPWSTAAQQRSGCQDDTPERREPGVASLGLDLYPQRDPVDQDQVTPLEVPPLEEALSEVQLETHGLAELADVLAHLLESDRRAPTQPLLAHAPL